jgi:hypothetical protein
MRTSALIALAGLTLAGCNPVPAAEPATAPAPASSGEARWELGIGKNSVEMAWVTDAAATDAPISLVCARAEGLMVVAKAFKPVGSEERLTIGAGDDAFALVAVNVADPNATFVRATGPADEALLTAIASGRPISASYGAQHYGPIAAPPEALRRAFADTCRKLNAGPDTRI